MTKVQGILNSLCNKDVTFKTGDDSVKYRMEGAEGTYSITPGRKEDASAVWHAIVNDENMSSTVQDKDDSYFVLANGSWIKASDKALEFQTEDDLRLDNLNNLGAVEAAIRAALQLVKTDTAREDVTVFLKKGTALALGSSVLTLLKDTTIVITGISAEDFAADLEKLRAMDVSETDSTELMRQLLSMAAKYTSASDNFTVTFEFETHEYSEPVWNWDDDYKAAEAVFICSVCGETVKIPAVVTAEGSEGVVTYKAVATDPNGKEWTDTKTVNGETDDFKFRVVVSSQDGGKTGSVSGTVYGDYTGILIIDKGTVNTSNAAVDVFMQNVASLGVTGLRSYHRAFTFSGTQKSVDLKVVANLFQKIDGAKIRGICGDKSVVYTVEASDDGYYYAAKPESQEKAGAVWHAIVNEEHITTSQKTDEDSYLLIKNGFTLETGSAKLAFEEDYDKDLRIDDLGNLSGLNAAIREALRLSTDETSIGDQVVIHLPKGTELALGSSKAVLNECVTITITGDAIDSGSLTEKLTALRDDLGEGTEDWMKLFLSVFDMALNMVAESEEITVQFDFGHIYGEEPVWNWAEDYSKATAAFACEICGEAEELEAEIKKTEQAPDCETAGKTVYTATVTFGEETYTDTKETETPATGHEWGPVSFEWAEDYTKAVAKAVCRKNESHMWEKTVEAAVEEDDNGNVTFTVTVTGPDGKTYTDSKLVENYKFRVKVSSTNSNGENNAVTGTVYANYKAELLIDKGNVNSGNALLELFMKNVASLGVTDARYYRHPFNFGEGKDVSLALIAELFKPIDNSTVIVNCDDNNVAYTVTMTDKEGYAYQAVPNKTERASAVWHAIVNKEHLESGTKAEDDSYMVLGNGSSLQIGSKILQFDEAYEGNLKLDQFDDLSGMEEEIRKALVLQDAEEAQDAIVIRLAEGTELAVGQSYVKLAQCVKIVITGTGLDTEELEEKLAELQKAELDGAEAWIRTLMDLLKTGIGMTGGEVTTVDFVFGHEWELSGWTWAEDYSEATALFICKNDKAHTSEEKATITKEVTEATCEEGGKTVYTATVTFDGETYTDTKEETTEAIGHDYGDPTWTWAEDYSSATATFVCKNDETHTSEEKATITKEVTEATCEEGGKTVYTATVTFDGETFTDTKEEKTEALGHDYGDPSWTWAEDYSSATATFVCKNDASHTVVRTTTEIVVETDKDGNYTFTATVTDPEGKAVSDTRTEPRNFYRAYGKTRYQTSLVIAEEYKKTLGVEQFESIVLATGENFPDALTGSYLAIAKNAPIILVNTKKAASIKEVSDYVKKNLKKDGTVYILGGDAAVSKDMEAALGNLTVKRISGSDRYTTNLEILKEVGFKAGEELLITTGANYPDSLSASSTGKAIMIVSEALKQTQKDFLAGFGGDIKITILGGDNAVSEDLALELAEYTNGGIDRVSGATRYETSTKIAEKYFGRVNTVILAYAANFPDALCAGPLGYALGAPVLMTKTGRIQAADEYTADKYLFTGYVLGGSILIDDDSAVQIFNIESAEQIKVINTLPE
ncbi:MAG: cell wall-binding repeat-containing protein [Lachnospiraceae bacterium]|nr:cell wall-binding repeat-containing protein [Lachnospiraceae bacterium]